MSERLVSGLGRHWVIEHVGSTSVPGLIAKPVVDLAVRVPQRESVTEVSAAFVRLGWTSPVELGDHWATFALDDGVRTAIAHLFTAEQWPQAHVRLFAAWLRAHPRTASATTS
ncbi:MAG TPA: GrpB family protein [Actinomycetales bacterium]